MSALILGPVVFQGFEIPERLTLGGEQSLVIHRLPGGARVVDAMGADDTDISWSGLLTGPDALERARVLDSLRITGAALLLAGAPVIRTVLIASLELHHIGPWWVEYRIRCTPLSPSLDELVLDVVASALAVVSDADLDRAGTGLASADLAVNLAAAASLADLAGRRVPIGGVG
jgi:hypothetical protein